jgi:hypothetical protein
VVATTAMRSVCAVTATASPLQGAAAASSGSVHVSDEEQKEEQHEQNPFSDTESNGGEVGVGVQSVVGQYCSTPTTLFPTAEIILDSDVLDEEAEQENQRPFTWSCEDGPGTVGEVPSLGGEVPQCGSSTAPMKII